MPARSPGPLTVAGRIEIDPVRRQLWVDGQPLLLGGRAFDLLLCLAARPGMTIAPADLLAAAWPGRVVEASNLRVQVNALRKALGPAAITNVPKRGYLFTAQAHHRAGLPDPSLFGRDDALQQLAAQAAAHRLVTVVGAGGVGKSRLVLAWWALPGAAAGWRAWADLAPQSDSGPPAMAGAAAVLPVVADAFGLERAGAGPWTVAGLAAALPRDEPALLVLDGAEAHAGVLAGLLPALLQAAPALRVVVTSQLPLHLPQEQLLRLGPLRCPAPADPSGHVPEAAAAHGAVALFVARAQAVQPGFVLDAHTLAPVTALCHRLDGLPLAIELAAARLPTLGLAALLRGLDERLHLLTQQPGAAPPRQRTLRAALAWTLGLLDERTRTVFARVAVFTSPFTHDAAQQVVTDAGIDTAADAGTAAGARADQAAGVDRWAVLHALQALFDASLLQPTPGEPPQLNLPETPRLFALELLRLRGEEAEFRQRHAQWCATRQRRPAAPDGSAGADPVPGTDALAG
ncbi:MAG TPA: winged helix-turn-helix domain-containing protein [Aquabacterium sp.]|nr:winged helix-turn-helix domain-containing protein [Aquabacterium sp.]HQC95457.1 winged helix-turn-helix domain-containing protein [Aquabacterium sp.]